MNDSRLTINGLQFRLWTWYVVVQFVALVPLISCQCARAAEPEQTNGSPSRYLFIVDTSSAMRRYAENTRKVINDLLLSGIKDQLRAGDTIGVWTFNEVTHTGEFPLQRWTPETRERIATGTVEFLKGKKFEKKGDLQSVKPALVRVVKGSEKITVLLVTGGETKFAGFPYEREVTRTYQLDLEEMRKQRMPFIFVLRAWHGSLIGGYATWSPRPLEFPPFPPEYHLTNSVNGTKAESRPAPQPLIVIGKKPEPVPVAPPPAGQTNVPSATIVAHVGAGSDSSQMASEPEMPSKPITPESPSPATHAAEVVDSSAQTAVAVPPQSTSSRTIFLVAGGTALIVALGLGFLLMRRQHSASRPSLITRSMNQEREQEK